MPSGLAAVPPAQLPSKYRDVVKMALQPRQTRAFILAAITWHLLLASALLRTVSLSLVSPLALAVSLLSFGLGVLPLLARRKRNLSSITTPAARLPSSRARQVSAALASPSLLPLVYQHVIAFAVLATGYTTLLTSQTGGWGPQIWVESHGSFYLNERFLYLAGHSTVLGAVYASLFRSLPSAETVASPRFDPSSLSSEVPVTIKDRVFGAVGSRLARAAAVAALTSISGIVVYSLIRIRLWSALLLVIGTRGVMRRLLVPSFRVDFGYIEVSIRTTLFSIAAVCAVETAYLLLDVYLSHPLAAVSKFAKNPNRLLLDGIDEPVVFFSNHAFGEAARLSANDKESRESVYRDVNTDVTAWTHIRDRCLALLEEQKQFVVRRGQVQQPAPATAGGATQQVTQHQQQQLEQQKSSTQPTPTIWDQLAAVHTPAKQQVAPGQTQATSTTPSNVKRPATATAASILSLQTLQRTMISMATIAWRLVPADAKHVLFGPRRQQSLLGDSPALLAHSILGRDAYRTVSATQTLSSLLCHSLSEDPYGTVQKDIRRVLSAMVDLDSEIRRFGIELEQRALEIDDKLAKQTESPQQLQQQQEACTQELRAAWKASGASVVDVTLTASIREILATFAKFELALGDELEVKLGECLS